MSKQSSVKNFLQNNGMVMAVGGMAIMGVVYFILSFIGPNDGETLPQDQQVQEVCPSECKK
jgi:hypothetical protein